MQHDIYHRVNNLRVKKDTFAVIDFEHFQQIKQALTLAAQAQVRTSFSETVVMEEGARAIRRE